VPIRCAERVEHDLHHCQRQRADREAAASLVQAHRDQRKRHGDDRPDLTVTVNPRARSASTVRVIASWLAGRSCLACSR
jgi:hypothetical protein